MTDEDFDIVEQVSDTCMEVNDALAEDDGIDSATFDGRVGFHVYAATDGGVDAYWQPAFFQALNEALLRMMHVSRGSTVEEAREAVERELHEYLQPTAAEYVANLFEENLRELSEEAE